MVHRPWSIVPPWQPAQAQRTDPHWVPNGNQMRGSEHGQRVRSGEAGHSPAEFAGPRGAVRGYRQLADYFAVGGSIELYSLRPQFSVQGACVGDVAVVTQRQP